MPNKKEKIELSPDMGMIRSLDKLLGYAVSQEVKSILFDLTGDKPAVFYRFFSDWKKIVDIQKGMKSKIGREIRNLSNMDENKKSLPQVGKFKKSYQGFKAVFYVSANPLSSGEKIFIDIFKNKPRLFNLRQLGLQRVALNRVEENLSKESGMSIVVGDFDSGRTSTLYSFLDYLNRPELNICTIEDEIDLDLPDINQSRLDPKAGFDYSFALNSILKQDPDVIMVGDIDNKETAENSFLAADAGYPVLVGVYSRDAITALQLLRDLEISLPLFLKAVNMFLNQRVAKKICHHCIVRDKKSNTKIKELKKSFDWKFLLPRLRALNIVPKNIRKVDDMVFYKGKGCERCRNTGFAGSIGVYEVLEVTSEVIELARKGHLAKIKEEIRNQEGFYIKEDALIKAFNGIITIDEVLKMIKE